MSKSPIQKVEIVEPPIGELTKKTYTWKRSCFTSCFSIIFFLAVILIGLRLYIGAPPKTYKTLPSNFPKSIPLYDKENVENITYITGYYKTRGLAVAAVVPKLLLSPLLVSGDQGAENRPGLFSVLKILTSESADWNDTIRVVWHNLEAEPGFVVSYYKTELKKAGYSVTNEASTATEKQFSFNLGNVGGTVYAKGDPYNKTGTDFAVLTVSVPPKK